MKLLADGFSRSFAVKKNSIAAMLSLIVCVMLCASLSEGYTNPIEGGSTVTVTNSWTVPDGDLYVGQTTQSNSLIISSADVYSSRGYIGSHAGSDNNLVILERATRNDPVWHNREALYLGGHREGTNWVDGGVGNILVMQWNVGMVIVGDVDPSTIDNPHSVDMVIGDTSGTPEVVIANGSRVYSSGECYVGYGTNESGSVEVRGADSLWIAGGWGGAALDTHLYVGRNGSGNKVTVSDGGLIRGAAFLGYGASSSNNIVRVTGPDSRWEDGYVTVGHYGSGNRLEISDGGQVDFRYAGMYVGQAVGSDNNAVLVEGNGSELNLGDYIRLGSAAYYIQQDGIRRLADGGRGNALYVNDGGRVTAAGELYSQNYSLVSIDGLDSRIVVGYQYFQDATSVFRFGVGTNSAESARLSVAGKAEFESEATLQYHGNPLELGFDRFSTNLIVSADQLVVGGVTSPHDLSALEVVQVGSSLVDLALWESDQNIYGLASRRHLAESAGFAPGSQMAMVSGEIDSLSVTGNALAVDQINLLNRMSASQQDAELTQRYAQGAPSYRHSQTLAGGRNQILSRSRTFQSSARSSSAPSGPAGPHKEDQELRGWIQGYGSWADHEGTTSFSGFEQNVYGTIVGLDKAYGHVLLGAAGGYARSDLTQDNNDSSDAKTGYGVLYASLGTVDWFGDLLVSYGQSQIDTQSGTLLGGSGNFTADNVALYLGGGKEIRSSDGDGVVLTPEAALMVGYYGQDAYTDGLMQVDAYDRWSSQSRIGAALRLEREVASCVVSPEFRTYWLHEFNADPDQIGYSLIGGTGRYSFGVQAPVEDFLEIGLGLSIAFNDRIELVFDVDSQYSKLYQAISAGGRVLFEF